MIASTTTFAAFVAFEVARSIKLSGQHAQSRLAEIDREERRLLNGRRGRPVPQSSPQLTDANADGEHGDRCARSNSGKASPRHGSTGSGGDAGVVITSPAGSSVGDVQASPGSPLPLSSRFLRPDAPEAPVRLAFKGNKKGKWPKELPGAGAGGDVATARLVVPVPGAGAGFEGGGTGAVTVVEPAGRSLPHGRASGTAAALAADAGPHSLDRRSNSAAAASLLLFSRGRELASLSPVRARGMHAVSALPVATTESAGAEVEASSPIVAPAVASLPQATLPVGDVRVGPGALAGVPAHEHTAE